MIELEGQEVAETIVSEAFDLAQQHIDEMVDIQQEYLKLCAITPQDVVFNKPSPELVTKVTSLLEQQDSTSWFGSSATSFSQSMSEFQTFLTEEFASELADEDNEEYSASKLAMAGFQAIQHAVRQRVLSEKLRLDNRDLRTIRPLYTRVDVSPRAHGS